MYVPAGNSEFMKKTLVAQEESGFKDVDGHYSRKEPSFQYAENIPSSSPGPKNEHQRPKCQR
ncbi:hypothetical protein DPMN_068728 [Dreissena polymorpha]|nr:hypothetical protein DPMN_068728 [Dreissena polymorpha]